MIAMYTHQGSKITVRDSHAPPVAVFDSRFPRDPAVYKCTSLDIAMRWIDAYVKGEQWAVASELSAEG